MIASIRKFLPALAAGAFLASACVASLAQAQQTQWPRQPVKLYVGASAGGAPDTAARLMAKMLQETWGQPLVIDNRPGAAGLLAGEVTAQAAPDGHSLALVLDSVIVNLPLLSTDKLPIDTLTDLKPVSQVGAFPLILIANAGVKYRNLREFIAAAKAAPGKIDYASSGIGSSVHLAMEVLQKQGGFEVHHVPYKGGIPGLQDTIAGHVAMMWSSITAAIAPLQSGKVIALGVGSAERFPLLPNVPTVAEQGFPGYTASNWMGIFGPKALPDALVQRIQSDFAALARNPGYREAMIAQGIEPRALRPDEFARQIQTDYNNTKAMFATLKLGPAK